jgi:hypothetical protein
MVTFEVVVDPARRRALDGLDQAKAGSPVPTRRDAREQLAIAGKQLTSEWSR